VGGVTDAPIAAIDEQALSAFLTPILPLAACGLVVDPFPAGHSNLTFMLRCGGESYVLRRPPVGPLPPTAHDVLREYRVLSGLATTSARIPRPVLACEDERVIGAPFYVMECVDGTVLREDVPAGLENHEDRQRIGREMVDALVELHAVDWRSTGLVMLAPPSGYLERQVRRWQSQWGHNKTRELPDLDAVGKWIKRNMPASSHAGIVHGDYKLDNVIFDLGPPVRAKAIVDWEMAALGDPLADVGYLTALWAEPGNALDGIRRLGGASSEPGFSSRRDLIERYSRASHRDVDSLNWYQVFALWKLAIILEGGYRRYLAGTTTDRFFSPLRHDVPQLAACARASTVRED